MSEEDEPVPARIMIAAGVVAACHFVLLFGAAVLMLYEAPRMKRLYDDYGMKLPYATDMVLRAAMYLDDYSWAAAVGGVLVLVADVGVFVAIASNRRNRALAWAWVAVVTLGLLAVPGLMWYAINLPHAKLLEAMAK
jgi:type II secretory pathway component PulF